MGVSKWDHDVATEANETPELTYSLIQYSSSPNERSTPPPPPSYPTPACPTIPNTLPLPPHPVSPPFVYNKRGSLLESGRDDGGGVCCAGLWGFGRGGWRGGGYGGLGWRLLRLGDRCSSGVKRWTRSSWLKRLWRCWRRCSCRHQDPPRKPLRSVEHSPS